MEDTESKQKSKFEKIIRNPYTWVFIFIFIFAIFTRIHFQFTDSIWNDEAVNMWNSYSITQGDIFDREVISEGFVPKIMSAFFILFTSNSFNAVRLTGLIFSLLGIVFIYLLGRELKDDLTGIIAAILLTAHHLYGYISAKGILDVPLTAMCIITAYCIIKMEHSDYKLWPILAGLFLILTMFTKQAGVLMLIIAIIYLAITRRGLFFKDKKVRYALGIPIIFLILGDTIYYVLFKGSMIKSLGYWLFSIRGLIDQPLNYTKILFTFILNPWIIIFLVIGIILTLFYKKKEPIFVFIWMLVIWIFFDVNIAGTTLPRYLLPLVPAAILIASFAIAEIGEFVQVFTKKRITFVLIILAILIAIPFYRNGVALHESKAYTYSGYQEAADWLTRNIEDNAVVFAGSPRTMRGLTRWQYYEFPPGQLLGGRIYYLRSEKYIEDINAFEKDLEENLKKSIPVYLEIDIWEYTQPSWYFPINQDSINYFTSIGFEPRYTVQREMPTQQGMQKGPVVILFKHTGVNPNPVVNQIINDTTETNLTEKNETTPSFTELIESNKTE